jgi:signal transduction histidine kinase
MPVRLHSQTAGILYLANKAGGFTEVDAKSASVFAAYVSAALHQEQLRETVEKTRSRYSRLSKKLRLKIDEEREQLRQAENLVEMGRMLSTVAHEIRNILQIIRMSCDALRPKVASYTDQLQLLDEITYAVGILNTLGSELLDYGKHINLNKEPCAIREVVENALATMGTKLQLFDLRLNLKNGNDTICIDRQKITRVLMNLVSNAIEAMPAGGTLTISSGISKARRSRTVSFSIADSGCGIPKRDIDRIQLPFVTTKEYGAGLGIPICKRIVEAHSGKILITSKRRKGTTIKILLPLEASESA